MSETTTTPAATGSEAPASGALRRILSGTAGRNLGLIIALLVIVVVGWITGQERFMDLGNLVTIVRYGSILGVVAIGMTFVITAGGIDLSVGSVIGLASVVASLSWIQNASAQSTWLLMVVVAIAVGGLAGLVNGIVIAYGKVVPFIATLAMLVAARGLAEIFANKTTQVVSVQGFLSFFRGNLLGIPWLIWIFAIVAVIGWFLLARTTFGRRTVAIGGNFEAARLAGLKVKRHTVSLYVISGLTAGIAAVMFLARTNAGSSTHGTLYELDAIAAVVVGGTLLIGGRGTIVGTVLGVLIFSTLSNIFTMNNLNISVQAVVKGVIIVAAVLLQQRLAERSTRSR
ncbi:ABC transporter permease [Protaetiibacter larvae]|uniref:ABC transporter permease n=1 Tax=Protaetiibacter larvae TaxID=2592654 RepID=A0A5C1Y5P9_9MICO|nr:ABC transporter permease [Protaetiibacter larvae]QEO08728.1 ABC transporter permease [Protaetiibacter larvae]